MTSTTGPAGAGSYGSAARRPVGSSARGRVPSEFAELSGQVRALGLLGRRRRAYGVRSGVLAVAGGATAAWIVLIGPSWWQLVPAVVAGVIVAQLGFLAHDAAHRQVFASWWANEWGARLLSTLGIGLSYGWWTSKHNRHHRSPNQAGRDPDVASGGLAFTPQAVEARPAGLRLVTRNQGYLFFPMLLLEGVNLHVAGLRTLAGRRDLYRRLEACLIIVRFAGYGTALTLVMSPVRAAVFLVVQLAVFGLFLGAAFAPNHKGMPMLPGDARVDFMRRQVLMSRNIRGGWLIDAAMGGLNYQIEHHQFPSMPRDNLRLAQPVIRDFCRAHDIAYTETSLTASYRIVIRYLNDVGLGARDPFDCPFLATYRT